MHRGVLLACGPWLLMLVGLVLVLRWLLVLSGARLRWVRLAALHHDQQGGVQSLSFVLTLPVFIMVLLLIVQVSQLMVAQIVVEYAAVAAARAAMVWIPANLNNGIEGENRISTYQLDPDASNSGGGTRLLVSPGSPKYEHIRMAAVLACLPIAPSRSVGAANPDGATAATLASTYKAMSPSTASNTQIPTRIRNKLAYSSANTTIKLHFVHKAGEMPLTTWFVGPDEGEFYYNEVGWQDTLQVTVFHQLALLPGPGRLLWSTAASPTGAADQVSQRITHAANSNVYSYQLTSSAALGNDGEKSVLTYVYSSF